jgi:outer membrane lipoprotein LolB
MRLISLLTASLLLAACATVPSGPLPARDTVANFSLDARFALRLTPPGAAAQSSSGRLSWQHGSDGEHILIANPLGVGVAEIDSTPSLSRLRTGNNEVRESSDPDELVESVTGQRLPIARLPAWLLGRSSGNAKISRDLQGRPQELHDAPWQVAYFYDDESPDALPARLEIRRGDDLELRLRIEEWRTP